MDLAQRLARFAPVELTAERGRLSAREQAVAEHLISAGRRIGDAYLCQIWPGNLALRERLAASPGPEDRLRLRLFELMGGPWDTMDQRFPFAVDHPRPAGAAFYPEDLTKEELTAWLEQHPADRAAFSGYFSVIRRRGAALAAVPFHEEYREHLEPAAQSLEEAARLADYPPLAEYLRLRARALLDDDYFESDCAWVALQDGPFEVVVGPYEVYDDGLFGYKASYECMVALRDVEESARFRAVVDALPTLHARLPVAPEYRGRVAGLASPIVVADTVYNSGQLTKVAIATAFVLPNDARIRTTVGTKKVMIKNVARAKFANIFYPVTLDVLTPEQAAMVTFEDYFAHVLLHEVSHALGERNILQPDGSRIPLHQTLRDLYSPIEECKADIVGLYNVLFLAGEGFFPREWRESAPATYVAGCFRMARTGGGAHARANLIGFNFLRERGAIRQDAATGRFWAEASAVGPAVEELSGTLLQIEGRGDYAAAQALVQRYAFMPPEMEQTLAQVRPDLPLDLAPTFPWAT